MTNRNKYKFLIAIFFLSISFTAFAQSAYTEKRNSRELNTKEFNNRPLDNKPINNHQIDNRMFNTVPGVDAGGITITSSNVFLGNIAVGQTKTYTNQKLVFELTLMPPNLPGMTISNVVINKNQDDGDASRGQLNSTWKMGQTSPASFPYSDGQIVFSYYHKFYVEMQITSITAPTVITSSQSQLSFEQHLTVSYDINY